MAQQAKPRVTVSLAPDGGFEISVNEAGRDQLIAELQKLGGEHDHFHLDYFADPRLAASTDVLLSAEAENETGEVLESGKVVLRPNN